MKYRKMADRRWRKAEWITGEGRFALLAHCGVLTVTLWKDFHTADKQKTFIDQTACGGKCHRHHEIIDLDAKVN